VGGVATGRFDGCRAESDVFPACYCQERIFESGWACLSDLSETIVPSLTLTRSDIIPPPRISSTKAFEKRLVPALLRLSSSQLPIGSSRKRARRPASPKAVHIVLVHHRAISTAIVVGIVVVVYGIRLLVEIGRRRGFLEFPTGDFGVQLRVSEISSI
jgi:hypothetical protein